MHRRTAFRNSIFVMLPSSIALGAGALVVGACAMFVSALAFAGVLFIATASALVAGVTRPSHDEVAQATRLRRPVRELGDDRPGGPDQPPSASA